MLAKTNLFPKSVNKKAGSVFSPGFAILSFVCQAIKTMINDTTNNDSK